MSGGIMFFILVVNNHFVPGFAKHGSDIGHSLREPVNIGFVIIDHK
jgi:hypothetical protein